MSEDDITRAEEELGVEFPESYRRFLGALAVDPSDDYRDKVWQFNGEVFDTADALIQVNQQLSGSDWLEDTEWEDTELDDLLAVAGDGCGNYFLIDPADDQSEVFFLSHDPVEFYEAFPSFDAFREWIDRQVQE